MDLKKTLCPTKMLSLKVFTLEAPAVSSQAGLLSPQDRLIAGSDADAAAEDRVAKGGRTTEETGGGDRASGSASPAGLDAEREARDRQQFLLLVPGLAAQAQ
ncbi:unnamed protein product [Coccothraustes coccothraustes]